MIDTKVYYPNQLKDAAEQLKAGQLVAFPTETVFGLGAMANNDQAIAKVFEVKGRPADNPLIVHVSSIDSVKNYVTEIHPWAQKLMEAFWPGPLTIIFPTNEHLISPLATTHQPSVGLRMPNQIETLLLIDMVGFPLVGPSANLSTKPSPTQVEHVLHDFSGKIAGVVANRQPLTEIGVESTVVYPTDDQITILRPGYITADMIQEYVDVPVVEKTAQEQLSGEKVMSPGVKYKHYAPKQPVYLVPASADLADWQLLIDQLPSAIGLLADQSLCDRLKDQVAVTYSLGAPGDILTATRNLYAGLRYFDQRPVEAIIAQGLDSTNPQARAYMNRLSKASQHVL